ncbi:MAG TPA: hypothetical protein VF771_19740 [Longimicrobiaceae bacterium]
MILRTFALACFLAPAALHAQSPGDTVRGHPAEHHEHGEHHHDGLHFSHPLVTESVSPDTKVRVDYARTGGGGESELEMEGEYAFTRSFSIEAGLGYDLAESAASEAEIAAKLAHYGWEERGILVGGGVLVGIPLRSEAVAGVEEEERAAEVAPFVHGGLRAGGWELTAITRLGFTPADTDAGTRLGVNASALYHLTPRIETMLEYQGAAGLSGEASGSSAQAVAPGLKVRPFEAAPGLAVGASMLVPFSGAGFDARLLLSTFYHF